MKSFKIYLQESDVVWGPNAIKQYHWSIDHTNEENDHQVDGGIVDLPTHEQTRKDMIMGAVGHYRNMLSNLHTEHKVRTPWGVESHGDGHVVRDFFDHKNQHKSFLVEHYFMPATKVSAANEA